MKSDEKVDMLRAFKIVQRVMGVNLYENDCQNFLNKIINFILAIIQSILMLSILAYSLHHLSDIGEASNGFMMVFALVLNLGQYLLMVFRKAEFRQVLVQFQEIVDKSDRRNCTPFVLHKTIKFQIYFSGVAVGNTIYEETEQNVHKFSSLFYAYIVSVYTIVLGMPFYIVIYHLVAQSYTSDSWILPYPTLCVCKLKNA